MKVLLVEDNLTYLKALEARLSQISGVDLVVARSRDSARTQLERECFDLIICDLKIPPVDGELDPEIEHGESAIAMAKDRHPGTPIIILSAFGTVQFAADAAASAQRVDVIGDGNDRPLVRYHTKDAIDRCITEISDFAERLNRTDSIEIRNQLGSSSDLTAQQARVIRIFARRLEGEIVQVTRLQGGLSDTSTFKVKVHGRDGRLRGRAFAKIGTLAKIEDEARRFRQLVSPTLPVGSHAPLQEQVRGGSGDTGGVFFVLAEDARSLFEVLQREPAKAADIVASLANRTHQWLENAPQEEVRAPELRKRLGLADEFIHEVFEGVDLSVVEAKRFFVRRATQHGDLHPANVLIDGSDQPVLIDFGQVGELVAGYDAVVLELSPLFHPEGVAVCEGWPTLEQVEHWENLDVYLPGCRFPDFIRACRTWAHEASPSDRTVLACVYVYALRQLKYTDTNKDRARALVACAVRCLRQE